MTKENDQDPSIEEILASIRQIISDDDLPADEAKPAAPVEAAPLPKAEEPPPSHPPEEEPFETPILDLTEEADAPAGSFTDALSAFADLDKEDDDVPPPIQDFEIDFRDVQDEPAPVRTAAAPPAEPAKGGNELDDFLAEVRNESAGDMSSENEALFTTPAAEATLDAFSRLAENVVMSRRPAELGAITLEEIVKDLLRPMLRQWVNDNVPRLVEALVEKELEKLARRARDE